MWCARACICAGCASSCGACACIGSAGEKGVRSVPIRVDSARLWSRPRSIMVHRSWGIIDDRQPRNGKRYDHTHPVQTPSLVLLLVSFSKVPSIQLHTLQREDGGREKGGGVGMMVIMMTELFHSGLGWLDKAALGNRKGS